MSSICPESCLPGASEDLALENDACNIELEWMDGWTDEGWELETRLLLHLVLQIPSWTWDDSCVG